MRVLPDVLIRPAPNERLVIALLLPGARLAGVALRRSALLGWRLLTWRGWVEVLALLLLAGLALYLNRDAFLSYRAFFENDTTVFYYPLSVRLEQALREGGLPIWVRTIFAGFPLFADGESGQLYPLRLVLARLLDPWQAMAWQRVINQALAGWFMYAFGRAMGFRPFGAAFGAIVFAFGSFLVGQLHHSNVVRSAIWLPFIFFAVERALQATGRRRAQWLAFGSIGLGMQCLGLHIQIVLMTLLALALYLGYRWLLGPIAVRLHRVRERRGFAGRLLAANLNFWLALSQRSLVAGAAGALVVVLGLGIGAAQLLPLEELAQFSERAGGVSYSFASTYSLPVLGLVQAVTPYLFRTAAGQWWTLWLPWETAFYIGTPALVLGAMGILFARNRYTWFFAGLLLLSIWIALGPNAPLNLHYILWEIPGFSMMRAPGRFMFLGVFAAAALAGWGAHWLDGRLSTAFARARGGAWRSIGFSLFLGASTALPAALLVAMVAGRAWLDGHREEVLELLKSGSLAPVKDTTPAGLDAAFNSLRWALDLGNPSVALGLAAVQATVLLLVVWYGAPRLGHVWKGALLAVLAVDLLSFAGSYHPLITAEQLALPSGSTAFLMQHARESRTLIKGRQRSLEPNRLVPYGIPVLGGYSSLAPKRNLDYRWMLQISPDSLPDTFVDAASIKYIAASPRFPDYPSYQQVAFHPQMPLAQGGAANADSRAAFSAGGATGDAIGIVANLSDSVDIPQDAVVAELTVVTTGGERETVPVRAGRDVSEWAYEREDVRPRIRHAMAEKAFTFDDRDGDGRWIKQVLYFGRIPLSGPKAVQSIEYRYTAPVGALRLYGLGLMESATGKVQQVRQKTKYRAVYQDAETVVYENMAPMPHAYVVGQGVLMRPGENILRRMAEGAFDPRRTVLLEPPAEVFTDPTALVSGAPTVPPATQDLTPARMVQYEPTRATLEYTSADGGYLVLTDAYYPGWHATIDGEPAPIFPANYLFRAVRAPAGTHTVEFWYDSPSLQKGLEVSAVSLALAAAIIVLAEAWAVIRVLARGVYRMRSRALRRYARASRVPG